MLEGGALVKGHTKPHGKPKQYPSTSLGVATSIASSGGLINSNPLRFYVINQRGLHPQTPLTSMITIRCLECLPNYLPNDIESDWDQHMDPIWIVHRLCRWMWRWNWEKSTIITSNYRQWCCEGVEGWANEVQVGSQTGFGVGLIRTSDMGSEFEEQDWRVN